MTDAQRDELLVRMDERLKGIDDALNRDYKILHGNGQPGLISRVQSLENQHRSESRHGGIIAATVAFLVNAAMTAYAIFK